MIGVVVPAHDEASTIDSTIRAILRAAAQVDEPVEVVVVCDACSDATPLIAMQAGALVIDIAARNVGTARAVGSELLLARGARWLAFTDADTEVTSGWLAAQLETGAEAVCGTVDVRDWRAHGIHRHLIRDHFRKTYFDREGHRHIHGANLGVSADAYRLAGGFAPLRCSEDVALVEALEAAGVRIAWSAKPRVYTSARTDARARGGFGDTLLAVVAATLVPGATIP